MKVLVTGANGLLGHKLMHLLKSNHVEVIGTARTLASNHKGHDVLLDITSPTQTQEVLSQHRPDVIIHTAAMTQVDQCETDQEACYESNVVGVENIISAASKINTHLIHLSTDFIFDGTKKYLDENEAPTPVNYYGACKLESEKLVQSASIKTSIVRTVLVYGFVSGLKRSNIVLWVKKSLEEHKPIQVVDDQIRTPTLAEDLALGCWLTAQQGREGIFHISGDEMMTPYQMAIQTADCFGLDKSLISKSDSTQFKQTAKRPPITGFNISKAKEKLGYQPTSFQDGLLLMKQQIALSN